MTCTILVEATVSAATLQAQTYGFLKKYMTSFDASKFSKVVDLGSLSIYRSELASAKIVVDPKLKSVAKYDPSTETIYLSKDPRKVSSENSLKFGQTIWHEHELTHKIEDSHGDIGFADTQTYAERNIEYMTYIVDVALPVLERMENDNKATPEIIKKRWEYFLKKVSQAKSLPEIKEYPPDAELMAKWFGFKFDVQKIESFYKSGGGGSLIKGALSPSGPQESPSPISTTSLLGDWNINANNYIGILHITSHTGTSFSGTVNIDAGATEQLTNGVIAGNKVTFTRMWPSGTLRQDYTGTLSKDGNGKLTMKGTFTQNNADLYQWSATKA